MRLYPAERRTVAVIRIHRRQSGMTSGTEFVVSDQDVRVLVTKPAGEFFHHIYGPVASTGTADRDCKITPVRVAIVGDPVVEKACNIVEHPRDVCLRIEKPDDVIVGPGLRTQ